MPQCRAALCRAALYHAAQCRAVQGRAVQGRAVQGRAVPRHGMLCHTVPRCAMSGSVVAQHRMAWRSAA